MNIRQMIAPDLKGGFLQSLCALSEVEMSFEDAVVVFQRRLKSGIHTFVAGLPLSLLDRNLVCGNSLVGIGQIDELKDIADPDGGSLFTLDLQTLVGAGNALRHLTGERYGDDAWREWINWLGRHSEITPPSEFAAWKSGLLSAIDPAMGAFLYQDVPSRIRIEEIVWGGVRKDGIPDLRYPPNIPAAEAAYLEGSDRVFGVAINGEHRAYPLRILNAHEMANDLLGGEPIALAY